MRVKVRLGVLRPVYGRLVKAHRIWKGNTKYFVVRRSHAMKNLAEKARVTIAEIVHAGDVAAAAHENSNGQTAQKGTIATKPSFSHTILTFWRCSNAT